MINSIVSRIGIFFLRLLSYLPFWLLYAISSLLYYPIYYLIGYRRKVVRENLTKSFPEKSLEEIIRIEKDFYLHFTDMIFENIKMHSISRAELQRRITYSGVEHIAAYYKQGRNVLMCTGHYGSWEMTTLAFSLENPATTIAIYKPLTNKDFENWFTKFRTRFGAVFIPMRQTLRAMEQYKEINFTLCFGTDQSPVKEEAKYFLNFLNQPTPVLLGIEKIAKRTNSPIVYFKPKRIKRGHYHVECVPIVDQPNDTATYEITDLQMGILESIINENPAYWLWSHKRWKHKPENIV